MDSYIDMEQVSSAKMLQNWNLLLLLCICVEHPCPIGYQCPEGVPDPLPCANGSYTNAEKQSTCTECSAGNFCNGTTIQVCVFPEGAGIMFL